MDSAKAILVRGHGLVCLRENSQILVGRPDERELGFGKTCLSVSHSDRSKKGGR